MTKGVLALLCSATQCSSQKKLLCESWLGLEAVDSFIFLIKEVRQLVGRKKEILPATMPSTRSFAQQLKE
jgi:hypothetical protein